MKIASNLVVALSAPTTVLIVAEPAIAGATAVPGPLLGAGLPGLAVAGGVLGAIWVTRMLRKRGKTD